MDRGVGPPVEAAWLGKHALSLITHARLTLLNDLGGHVVQEVRRRVEAHGVTPSASGRGTSRDGSGILPPVSGGLARQRDHRVDEDQHAHASPCAYQRSREAAERLRHEDDIRAPVDRLDDAIGVGR